MVVAILYATLLLTAGVLAFGVGGAPERWGASIAVFASILTVLSAPISVRFNAVEPTVFAIDLAVMIAFVVLARFAPHFWPIWAAALATLGLWADVVRRIHPTSRTIAYAFNEQVWSWPILILISLASVRSWKRRRALSRVC